VPITVTEKADSRPNAAGERPSAELKYIVRGTGDAVAARDAVATAAPATFDGLVQKTVSVEPIGDGSDLWEGTVQYGVAARAAPPATGDSVFNFDTGGGTQHITQSLSTVGSYAAPGMTNPNFRGAIGVTHDTVEGVDITVPVYHFSETHYKPASQVTDAYKGTLFGLTGKVNSAAFHGCAAGECLFLGASGSKRGDDDWEITYRFAASPNRTNLTIGDITGVAKKGWEYLWVHYVDDEDATAKRLVKRPAFVRVEKVYETGDFSGLGI